MQKQRSMRKKLFYRMTMDELVDYRKKQRAYAVEAGKPLMRLDGCALLHPLIYAGLRMKTLVICVNRKTFTARSPEPVVQQAKREQVHRQAVRLLLVQNRTAR